MKKTLIAIAIAAFLTGHFGCSSSTEKPDAGSKNAKSGDEGSGDASSDAKPGSDRPAEGSDK